MSRRLLLAAALVAAALMARPATASDMPPVTAKLVGYTAPAKPGQPFSFQIHIAARSAVTLSSMSLTAPYQTDAITHNAPSAPVILSGRNNTRIISVSFTPSGLKPALRFSFLANGMRFTRVWDFSSEEFARMTKPATLGVVPETTPVLGAEALPAGAPSPEPVAMEPRFGLDKPVRAAEPLAAGAAQRIITVRGRLVFLRDDGQTLPVDGATVRIYDEDVDWDEHLITTGTGTDGRFQVNVSVSEDEPDLYLEFELANSRVVVEDGGLEFNYLFRTSVKDDFTGSTADFGTWQPSTEIGRAACHIFTNVTRGWRTFASIGWDTPAVDIQYPSSDWPHYDGSEIHIPLIVGDTEYGWHGGTHLHEYGHHLHTQFFYKPEHDYDNGICNNDNGDPGHCAWCEEDDGTAIKEGFADWVADYAGRDHVNDFGAGIRRGRSRESTNDCNEGVDWGTDPYIIEGYFSAMLRDIEDSDNETDPRAAFNGSDRLNIGGNDILTVMGDASHEGPLGWITSFKSRFGNLDRFSVWSTLVNNRYNIDEAFPGASPYFESTSHNEGLQYSAVPNREINMTWQAAPDDWSGVSQYSVDIHTSPRVPGTNVVVDVDEGMPLETTVEAPGPGNWYVTLRARDRAGNWSSLFATAGPYRIRDPIPADLAYSLVPPGGWDGSLSMRSNATATTGSAAPSSFLGSGSDLWWNATYINTGEVDAAASRVRFLVDGVQLDSVQATSVPGGDREFVLNRGPVQVTGGRHTFEVWADANHVVAETSENNNRSARQFVVDPDRLEAYTLHSMPSPPRSDAGHAHLPIGTLAYLNCDAVEMSHVYTPPGSTFSGTASWTGLYAYPVSTSALHDVDLRAFNSSTGSANGFTLPRATSARGSGQLDAVFTNRQVNLDNTWDVGVYRDGIVGTPYRMQQVIPSSLDPGDSITVTIGEDEMMRLYTFPVGTGEGGTYLVEVRGASAFVPVTTLWFDDDVEVAGIEDYTRKATSDVNGRSSLTVYATEEGRSYLVALYRNPTYRGAISFGLKLRLAQPDARPFTSYQWDAPLVPRSTADAAPGPAVVTPTLNGNGTTYMNVSIRNDGSVTAPSIETDIFWDGVLRTGPTFSNMTSGDIQQVYDSSPTTVPAGRHTLWLETDPDDEVTESDETDNVSGRQWVWEPDVLALSSPTLRKNARDADAGWHTLPEDTEVHWNQDAVRTPSFTAGMGHRWAAVAVTPFAGTDVDLFLHEKSTGSTNGFESPVVTSDWGAGETDYVLVDFANTAYRGFDAGLVRVDVAGVKDTAGYFVEVVGAQHRPDPFTTIGPVTMGYGQMLDLYTLPLVPGAWTFSLSQGAGLGATVDWGIALHRPGSPLQSRTDARTSAAWLRPAGASESFTVNVDEPGDYALAVFKTGAATLANSRSYTVTISSSVLDASESLPAATALRSAAPDPFVDRVRFGIELAAATDLRLEVLDVTGARRRVVASGPWAAGRHSLEWDGRDENGAAVAPGLYFVRMTAGGVTQSTKVVRAR